MTIKFDMKACVTRQLLNAGIVQDANESAAFARELEVIQVEAIEAKYPEFKYASLVPLKTDAPQGAQLHTYREVEGFGDAEFLENMAPEDFPTAEVKGQEQTGKFKSMGTKYMYSIEDLRRSAMMSIKPEEHKAKIARKVVESRFDRAIFNGVTGLFTGLAQDASSQDDTTGAAAAGTGNFATLAYATAGEAQKIVLAFQYMRDTAFAASNGLFEEFDLVVSPKCLTWLGRRLDVYSDRTIADFILAAVPGIRSISYTGRLSGVGAGGKDRCLMYPRDPSVLQAYIPIAFEQFPPQLRGMVFETYCHAKYGGMRIYHPNMIRRFDVTV